MPGRPPRALGIPSFLLPNQRGPTHSQIRWLSQRIRAPIPPPTPFVPDTQTFLTLIGRNLSQHASKIPSWRALFRYHSEQFKDLGIEPPRTRRYLLRWIQKFRNGDYGIGGDLTYVKDGVALLRIAEMPIPESAGKDAASSIWKRKVVVNVPSDEAALTMPIEQFPKVKGVKVKNVFSITGPHVLPAKGRGNATIKVEEGLWEDRRGRKIDGGERRQAEVRSKRRAEERRAAR